MSFISRLPAQHPARRYAKPDAIQVLMDDARAVQTIHAKPVAVLREYCAALLWLNSNQPVQLSDLEGLPQAQKSTLCSLLDLSEVGVPGAVCRRILAIVSGPAAAPAPSVGFYMLMAPFHPELDGDTLSLTRLAQRSSFRGNPNTRSEAQEQAAMQFWCADALRQADDVRALPIALRSSLELAHGVHAHWPEPTRADTVVSLVTAWLPRTGANSVASQAPVQQPQAVAAPAASAVLPPPAYGPPAAGAAQLQTGAWSAHSTQALGAGQSNLSATALALGFQNLSLTMQAHSGPQFNPLASAHFQSASSAARTPFDWIRDEGDQKLLRLQALYCSVTNLVTADERKNILDNNKVTNIFTSSGTSAAGSRPAHNCPYAEYPWQQPLAVVPGYGAAAQGKMCQIALRCDTAQYSDGQEKLIRDRRIEKQQELVNEFETAFTLCHMSDCLCQVDNVRRFLLEQMRVISVSATSDAGRYPQPEFGILAQARKLQNDQLPLFLTAVSDQIHTLSAGPEAKRSEVGMWKQFIDGWHISAQAGTQRDAALALTVGFGPAVGKARGFVPLESDSDDDAPASRSAPRDKTSKRVERKKKAQKDKVALTPYFPASSGILGASLGLEPPSGACKHCQGTGHFHSECPVYWAKRGHPLPGFTSSGRRVRSAWDDDNPKKEVFAAWVKFWKDKSIFENGPAVRDGAPDLAALKKASREGPPP